MRRRALLETSAELGVVLVNVGTSYTFRGLRSIMDLKYVSAALVRRVACAS